MGMYKTEHPAREDDTAGNDGSAGHPMERERKDE